MLKVFGNEIMSNFVMYDINLQGDGELLLDNNDHIKVFKIQDLGFIVVNLSNQRSSKKKINFINDKIIKYLENGEIDGVIIKRIYNSKKVDEYVEKHHLKHFINYKGYLIINGFSGSDTHFLFIDLVTTNVVLLKNKLISEDLDYRIDLLSETQQNRSKIAPDVTFKINGRVTVAFESAFKETLKFLIYRCYEVFEIPSVVSVYAVKIYPIDSNGTFKAVAFSFTKTPIITCTSVISFGTRLLSITFQRNIRQLIRNQVDIIGVLENNTINNDTANTEPFYFDIPIATIFSGSPIPQFKPNVPYENHIRIDLYELKRKLEKLQAQGGFN